MADKKTGLTGTHEGREGENETFIATRGLLHTVQHVRGPLLTDLVHTQALTTNCDYATSLLDMSIPDVRTAIGDTTTRSKCAAISPKLYAMITGIFGGQCINTHQAQTRIRRRLQCKIQNASSSRIESL